MSDVWQNKSFILLLPRFLRSLNFELRMDLSYFSLASALKLGPPPIAFISA